jgi:hypothetical protein
MVFILRAAATPTLRAGRSARWDVGIIPVARWIGRSSPGRSAGQVRLLPVAARPARRAACRWLLRTIGIAVTFAAMWPRGAAAFPFLDVTNQDQVPQGTPLTGAESEDLAHQLQLVNGLSAPLGGGWTILPRINVQEELTDNVLQVHSPREADFISYVAPGIGIAGDLPRITVTLDYSPTLTLYTQHGDLNSVTQQLNAVGLVTLVPDLAYLDVRAVSGVQNQYGVVDGAGTLGSSATATASTSVPVLNGNTYGLNRNNEVQTTSFGLSPYLLDSIRNIGSLKAGYSLGLSYSDTPSGFVQPPFPTGGTGAQTLISNEGYAGFDTGDNLGRFQDAVTLDAATSQTTTNNSFIDLAGTAQRSGNSTSSRDTVSDRISFAVSRSLVVFVSGGHEDITYSGLGVRPIHDLTWSVGGTLAPNPSSSLTVSYGHQDGYNALTVNGYYAVTARTTITASYGSTLGTQLETIQTQLNLAAPAPNGGLVNAANGGPLFVSTNGLPLADGVFRTTTLSLASTTIYDRDIINLGFTSSKQTTEGAGNNLNATSTTATVAWVHQMSPDTTFSAAASYSWQDQGSGYRYNPGNSRAVVLSLAYAHQISATAAATIRYSVLDQQSAAPAASLYQNILILGISKTF